VGSNFPPAIQSVVEWTSELVAYMEANQLNACEPTTESEQRWQGEVRHGYEMTLLGKTESWFTGYNSNVDGHDKLRHMVFFGGAPRLRNHLANEASSGYPGFRMKGTAGARNAG
jgi:hypothetical protein